jgi:hypothetical protein
MSADPCPAPLQCRSAAEVLQAILQLLPRGRAWQSNEGGPRMGLVRAFDPGVFDDPPFPTQSRVQSIMLGFWRAVANCVTFILSRYCDLRLEFWCATHKETHDLWMAEYGLPDACDPFPDLCTKVAAIGGTRCEYYAAVAARAGWSITCATGRLTFAPAGLPPAEHTSLNWTHFRTAGFPRYGWKGGISDGAFLDGPVA